MGSSLPGGRALARRNTELDKLKEQRRQLVEDEKRLRDNLAAVGRDTALHKQTLDKLGETEASITTLSTAIEHTSAEIETAKEQLQAFVSALTLAKTLLGFSGNLRRTVRWIDVKSRGDHRSGIPPSAAAKLQNARSRREQIKEGREMPADPSSPTRDIDRS